MALDIYTFTTILGITYFLQAIAILIQFFINKTYKGVGWWAISSMLVAAGYLLQLARVVEYFSFISIAVSNLMFVAGNALSYTAAMRFFDRRPRYRLLVPAYLLYSLPFLFFIYFADDISARIIITSSALAYYSLLVAYTLYKIKTRSITISANFISLAFFLHGLYHIFRAVMTLVNPSGDDFFLPSRIQLSTFIISLVASSAWTFGIILMINQRLNAEILESKEHFEVIFNTGPDIALFTRFIDGEISDVNEEFCQQIGYTREEVIGKTTQDIHLWPENFKRRKLITLLNEKGHIENSEGGIRCKDGRLLHITLSARIIHLHDIPHIISIIRDITVRKRAEIELQKSEKKYRELIQSANEVIVVIENGQVRLVNAAATNISGFHEADFLQRPFSEFIHPIDREMVLNQYQRRLNGEEVPNHLQFRILTKDEDVRWVESSAVFIEWEERPATLNFLTDITERKKIEVALRESEALHRAILEASPDGFIITSPEKIIQMVSPSILSILKYESEEAFNGKPLFDFIAPQDRELAEVNLAQLIQGENTGLLQYSVLMGDGNLLEIESNSKFIRDDNGNAGDLVTIIRDISARIQAQEALRQSEARFRMIAENTGDVIWILDVANDHYRYVSPSVLKLRGFTAEEVMNDPVIDSLSPESQKMIEAVMPERLHLYLNGIHETFTDEIAQPHKNGSIVWTETVSRFVNDDVSGGWVVLGVSRDITERKRLREELTRQATTDELTGASNRRHFLEAANIEIKRSLRYNHPLSLILLDIDDFKSINDTHGHAAGDVALITLTKIIRLNLRDIDVFARFGGDEFVILLPETELNNARRVIERINHILATRPLIFENKQVNLKISSGITSMKDGQDTLDILLGQADQALYQAKQAGRKRTTSTHQIYMQASKTF